LNLNIYILLSLTRATPLSLLLIGLYSFNYPLILPYII